MWKRPLLTFTRRASRFPCVDAHAIRESQIRETGPEPPYSRANPETYSLYRHTSPLPLTFASPLPSFDIAYETWGSLSSSKDNAILLHTGLSASSHAAATPTNPSEGWWDKFIGPGKPLD